MMRDQLEEILSSWDGRATAPLEQAFAAFHGQPGFLEQLTEISGPDTRQRSATWLLKHHFDKKGTLPEDLASRHLDGLSRLNHWEAKLHFLQYLERLEISEKFEDPLKGFVDGELSSENKFVRAWAHHALAVLALRFPGQKKHAIETLTAAYDRETAGSVRVRIRKALEKLNK